MTEGQDLRPLNVLIVEDEAVLAWDMSDMVEDAGNNVVARAASYDEVASSKVLKSVDLAFVDLQLKGDKSGIDVCRLLQERVCDATIIFATANRSRLPDDLAGGHGVIDKPVGEASFRGALHFFREGLLRPPPTTPRPNAMTLATSILEKLKLQSL